MKRLLFTLAIAACCLFPPLASVAKDNKAQHEVKQSHKSEVRSGQLVSILDLNGSTATQFKSLYLQYCTEVRAAQKKYAKIKPAKGQGKGLSDEQIRINLDNQFLLAQAILDIRKLYHQEYLKIMTPRQIALLYELEKKDGDDMHKMITHKKEKEKDHKD